MKSKIQNNTKKNPSNEIRNTKKQFKKNRQMKSEIQQKKNPSNEIRNSKKQ